MESGLGNSDLALKRGISKKNLRLSLMGIDDKSCRKGHKYITPAMDM
jgi:hypothetical protein